MPDFKSEIRRSIAGLNLSPTREEEIVEELSQDLEERFEQALNHGASEEEAKQLALDELTKPHSLSDQLGRVERPVCHVPQTIGAQSVRHRLFAGVWDDIRFAVRMLAKQPGFGVVAILTIGIGIGMSTLMLSIAHDVLIRPLPYANSDRLYAIYARSDSTGQTRIAASGPDYLDYREQNKSFNRIAEYLPRFTFTWMGDGEPKLVTCTGASEDFFATLGIRPYLGRLYEPVEYIYFKNDTMVVSHRFWKNQLGGDPHVIGRRIRLQNESVAIIGVLPPMSDLFPDTDVWPKLTTRPSYPFMQWRGNKFLRVVGELRPGITPAIAEEDLTAILRRVPEEPRDVRVQLVPLKEDLVGNLRLPLIATVAAAALILVVAIINVAALLLARAVKRQAEIALRLSLGADLPRIGQQLITEASVLSAAGCALGLFFAWSALRLLAGASSLSLPRFESVHLNAPALITTIAIASVITLLFGWLPALRFSRLPLSSALRSRGVDTGQRRRLSLPGLVVAEIACSVVLTISVGLLVHSFWRVMHVDPGFQARSLFRVYLRSESPPNDPEGLRAYNKKELPFWRNLLAETSSLPGVRSVAIADWRPGRDAASATLLIEGRQYDEAHLPAVEGSWVSAAFFRTVGTPLIAGRIFSEHDDESAPPVVIINTEAAHQFWPEQNPIGKRIGINYTGAGRRTSDTTARLREIVGIVGTMKHGPLDAPAAPAVYIPYLQDETSHDMSAMNLLVRADGKAIGLADSLRTRIHALRPDQPVEQIQNVEKLETESVAPRRYTLLLLVAFTVMDLVLAAVGVYGVISYVTAQRTREFGIRIALGATRVRVVSEVLRNTVWLTALGSIIGIACALVVARWLSTLLFEVSPFDIQSFSAAVALLSLVAIGASLLPAWRASRVDPLVTMQSE
jgi:putative ABC transport system permease protein